MDGYAWLWMVMGVIFIVTIDNDLNREQLQAYAGPTK